MAYSSIEIRCGGLVVNIATELAYPDAIDDLCARTLNLFKEGANVAKENGVDISNMRLITADYGDSFDDEDED
jgi:hypothetical protein